MSRNYTSATLIESVQRRCALPINTSTWTPTTILAAATEVMLEHVVPLVRTQRANHFRTFHDQAVVEATLRYAIPTEAMNRGLRNVAALDAEGNPVKIQAVDLDAEIDIGAWWRDHVLANPDTRAGYYIEGDELVLHPRSFAGTMRLYYDRLPNRLCRSETTTLQGTSYLAEAVQVVSVDTVTGAITCTATAVPAAITTSTPICVVQGTPGFRLKIASATPSAKTSTIVTLGNDIAAVAAAGIVAGDWVCLAGDSPVIQLPVELHGMVAEYVAHMVLRVAGDARMAASEKVLGMMAENYRKSFRGLRVDDDPREVASDNKLSDSVLGY